MRAGMRGLMALLVALGGMAEVVAGESLASGAPNVRPAPEGIASAVSNERPIHAAQDATIGVCKLIPAGPVNMPESAVYQIGAWSDAETYLKKFKNIDAGFEITAVDVMQQPKHGRLVNNDFYYPDPGYTGQDKIAFLVVIGSYKVKVVHFIQVISGIGNESYERLCPNPYYWKISSTLDVNKNKTVAWPSI